MKLTKVGIGLAGTLLLSMAPLGLGQDAPDTPASTAPAEATVATVEHWGGFIEIPMMKLGVTLVFERDADGVVTAMIDIPMQGANDLPLAETKYTENAISFSIPQVGASCMLERSDDTATGKLAQMGQSFPTTIKRYASAEEALASIQPKRPQEPKPPFPYDVRQVTIENEAAGVTLAGELTMPSTRELHPAVILISGSGPQDRNETIADHKPFLVLADHLTRNGIAVLRYDDRGVGGSTGSTMQSTVLDFQSDVEAWLGWLKEQPGIDAAQIGLIGHSEGGTVAPLVAVGSMKDDVAFAVLLAGMTLPGDEVVVGQTRALFERSGFPDLELNRISKTQQALIDALNSGTPDDELRALLAQLINLQNQAAPLGEAQLKNAVDMQMRMVGSKWYRHLMSFDPRPALEQVSCPMLAINGSLDLQVLPKENLAVIEEATALSGNKQVTIVELEGLNHLLQRSTSGLPAEYGILTQTIDPEVLDLVTTWIKQHTGMAE